MIAAEYYNIPKATKTANPGMTGNLVIVALNNGNRETVHETLVSGKVEARKIAAMFKAQPWNF